MNIIAGFALGILQMLYILVPTFAAVEHSTAFVCAPQLQCIIPHLFPAAFRARLAYSCNRLNIFFCQILHSRSLGP